MRRVLTETGLKERFAERDIRAKAASDAEDLLRAQRLMGHADAKLTKRFYMRKAQRTQRALNYFRSTCTKS